MARALLCSVICTDFKVGGGLLALVAVIFGVSPSRRFYVAWCCFITIKVEPDVGQKCESLFLVEVGGGGGHHVSDTWRAAAGNARSFLIGVDFLWGSFFFLGMAHWSRRSPWLPLCFLQNSLKTWSDLMYFCGLTFLIKFPVNSSVKLRSHDRNSPSKSVQVIVQMRFEEIWQYVKRFPELKYWEFREKCSDFIPQNPSIFGNSASCRNVSCDLLSELWQCVVMLKYKKRVKRKSGPLLWPVTRWWCQRVETTANMKERLIILFLDLMIFFLICIKTKIKLNFILMFIFLSSNYCGTESRIADRVR